MALGIIHSYSGMNTIRNLSLIQRSLSKTMQKLSSGERINEAADGPAELVISEQMRAQIGSITQQIKNLEFNLNKNNAADVTLQELRGKLGEMRTTAIAAADAGSATPETGKAYQALIDDLVSTYNQQVQNASFGNQKLFDKSKSAAYTLADIPPLNVSTPEDAADTIQRIDALATQLNDAQVKVGSKSKNEYESTIRSLEVTSQNLSAAESAIRDTDYAVEQANYLKQMVQLNVGLAAMAQGNLVADSVFKLLHA